MAIITTFVCFIPFYISIILAISYIWNHVSFSSDFGFSMIFATSVSYYVYGCYFNNFRPAERDLPQNKTNLQRVCSIESQ